MEPDTPFEILTGKSLGRTEPFQKKQLQDNYLFKNDPTFLNNFVKEEVSGWELGVGEA